MDLDLNLPFSDAPPLPPPSMSNNAYLEFVEFNLQVASENQRLEEMIAARPRPNPEWFVLDSTEAPYPALEDAPTRSIGEAGPLPPSVFP